MLRILAFILVFQASAAMYAQQIAEPTAPRKPFVIVTTGIGIQWFDETIKKGYLSLEYPVTNYWHIGIQGATVLNSLEDNIFFYSDELTGGKEWGVYGKYFFHGRLSGRKSGLYVGLDIRGGTRDYRRAESATFPPPVNPEYRYYKVKQSHYLLAWGLQWQMKHAVLNFSAPIGVEFYQSKEQGSSGGLAMLPTLMLGFAF